MRAPSAIESSRPPTPPPVSAGTASKPEIVPAAPDPKLLAAVPAPKGALLSDGAFREARKAYEAKDVDGLRALLPQLGAHPLKSYAQYWLLMLEADRKMKSADSGEHEWLPLGFEMTAKLARFVIAHEDEYIGERMRTDWARMAARSGDAATFNMLRPQLVWNRNEADIVCWNAYFALKAADTVQNRSAAKSLLLSARSPQAPEVRKLADELLSREPGWSWTYALILMQKKHFTMTRELIERTAAGNLPVSRTELLAILSDPVGWLAENRSRLKKASPRTLAFASLRLLAIDTASAAEAAEAAHPRLSEQARAMLWGWIGYTAAVDLEPEALEWYARAGSALARADRGSFTYAGDQLQLWKARAALRTNDPTRILQAVSGLNGKLASSPNWIYWKAWALERTGQKAQAESLYLSIARRTDFYGLLACDALGRAYNKGAEKLEPPASTESFAIFASDAGLNRALRLYDLGMYAEGHREWNWAMREMGPRERAELAEYAAAVGAVHRTIFTSLRLDQVYFSQRFPMPHRAEIELAAASAGLPPAWLFGVIHQESRFIRLAKSSVGALGLMQVMPRTARWVAQKIALANYKDGNLTRMETNLLIGAQYLRLVADSVDGNIIMTAAGYNAGPIKAQTWRAMLPQELSAAAFAETIPYGETRDYVMRVAANCVQYSRYTENPLRLTDFIGRIAPRQIDPEVLP